MRRKPHDPETTLLAAVAAAPDDDAPRLSYAAWLTERGDPRGELIALQCALARGDANDGANLRAQALLDRHRADWLAALGLRPDEGTLARGFIDRVEIAAARGPAVIERLLDHPLRELILATDLGGNDDEIAEVIAALRARLPVAFRRLRVDRRRHWDDNAWSDQLTVHGDGEWLELELGEPVAPRAVLPVAAVLLDRHPDLRRIAISMWARGPVDIDDIVEMLVTCGVKPSVQEVSFDFCDHSGIDWMRWLRSRRLAELLPLYPGLRSLSVPMAELWFRSEVPFAHANLRQLELHWLGMTPMGPKDPWSYGPPSRASGLTFLRTAELPALERLAVDLQMNWYVPWEEEDIAALCEANLPRLTTLELRYGDHPIATRLPNATFAPHLEHIDLTGTEMTDDQLLALIDARAQFASLRGLTCLPPLDASEDAWAAFVAVFPVVSPD